MAKNGTLKITILGDEKPLKQSLGKAEGILKDFAKAGPAIFAGMGIAAAGVFASQFMSAMKAEKMGDRLAAQLAGTPEQSEKWGRIAGDVYAAAYGDSLEQVHDALGEIVSTFGDLDASKLQDLTEKSLDLATAFDVDVQEAVNALGVVLRTGLVSDADEAFDLTVAAMQRVPAAMRGELLPILEEYSQDFAAMGISGDEAFAMLVDAAGRGRFELDKTGDAVKELGIRATELEGASADAFEAIGLNAGDMAAAFVTGGDQARDALQQTVDGLLAVEDPAERAELAVALFGTPIEDLNKTEIPEFLQSLSGMRDGLGQTEGAAKEMGDTLNDNVSTKFEEMKRRTAATLREWIQVNVLPSVNEVMDLFNEKGLGAAIDRMVELWEEAQPAISAWWNGTFMPWWRNVAMPVMQEVGTALGEAFVDAMMAAISAGLSSLGKKFGERLMNSVGLTSSGASVLDGATFDGQLNPPGGGGGGGGKPANVFHSGGMASVSSSVGGLAVLADKERVLSPRQTVAFEKLVDMLGRAGGGGNITINMPPGSDGDDVVRALKRWTRMNGPLPVAVRG